jgi:pilus assembly protein CpaE
VAATIALIAPVDQQLERTLQQLGYSHVVLPASRLAAFVNQGAGRPDIILADVRERPQLLSELGAVRRSHAEIGIIIVARLDPQLMLEAMRAGITECVTEPVEERQLEAAIRRVSSVAPSTRGEVFGFIGAKGGVGTTTLAVNVATVLARGGHSVLFADLHLAYGDSALYFGAEARFSIVDALDNIQRLDQSFLRSLVASTTSKVDLLASADRDPGRPVDLRGLRNFLDLAVRHYRYVILDVPRAGRAVVDPLEKADAVVVVSNHELSALRSASHLSSTLRERYGSARVSLVVSRFDRASEITHQDIERAVGEPIKQTLPSDYRVALEALNKGRPLVLENHSKLASSIKTFTQDLARLRNTKDEPPDPRPGLLGRLTGKR